MSPDREPGSASPAVSVQTPSIRLQYPQGRRGAPGPGAVRDWLQHLLAAEGRCGEICVRFVDADESAGLNKQFRQRDYPTNVLSFPAAATLPAGLPADVVAALGLGQTLGDLVVCVPVVQREAAEQGKPVRDHYAHMLIHGALHLLGYDHIEEAEAEAMEQRERDLLAQLGIADPYQERHS